MSKGSVLWKTALFEKRVKKSSFLSFLIKFPEGQYTPQNSKTRKIGFFGGSKKGPFWPNLACQKWQKPPLKVPGKSAKSQKTSKKVKNGPFFQEGFSSDPTGHSPERFRPGLSKIDIFLAIFGGVQNGSFLTRFWNFTLKSDPQRHLKTAPEKSLERGKNWNLGVEKKGFRKNGKKTCFSKIDFWDCRRRSGNLIKNDEKSQKSQKWPEKTGG